MKVVSGRQASVGMMGVRLAHDHLEGAFYAYDINDRIRRLRINVTYIDAKEMGSCIDGTYTGGYATLLNNESDWFQMGLTAGDCDVVPGHFGPVNAAMENVMLSFRRNGTHAGKVSQFIAMMKTTSAEVYVTLFLTVFVIQQLLVLTRNFREHKHRSVSRTRFKTFWIFSYISLMMAMFVRQLQPPIVRSFGRRQLFLAYMILAFFVGQFVMYMYECSLMIKERVEAIDTLEDLARSKNYTANFPYAFNLWRQFKRAPDFPIHQIWEKTMLRWNNDTSKFLKPLDRLNFESDVANYQVSLMLRPMIRFVVDYFCQLHADSDGINGYHPFVGKEWVLPEFYALIVRKGIDPELRKRLHWFYISNLEHGYNHYFLEYSDIPYHKPVEIRKCNRNAYDRSFLYQDAADVADSSYLTLVQGYEWMIMISAVLLLIESLRARLHALGS